MEALWQDLRYGIRMLAKRPGFTAGAVAILALGIGANAALFSVVRGVLLRPLPYDEPHRLVQVWDTNLEKSRHREGPSSGNVVDWRERNSVLEGIGAWYVMGRTLRTEHDVEVVNAAQVSADFFPVLRARPHLGRTFTPEETARSVFNTAAAPRGTDPVVILSHRIWQQRFGADPEILGRTVSLERRRWRVLGVMPASFAMPDPEVDLWIPWSFQGTRPRDQHYLRAIARLRPGISLERAEAEMNAIAAALAEEYPETNRGWGVRLTPLHEEIVGKSRRALLVLLGAVGFVLLIACANVAALQLARASERRREVSVRAALGASRARLVGQFLVESLTLAALGGILGSLFAYWGVDLFRSLPSGSIPRLHEVSLDLAALGFAVVLSGITGIGFGLIPALEASRTDPVAGLKEDGTRGGAGPRRQRLRGLLVVSEVAIALILLAGAGLLFRSFLRLQAVDPGFEPKNVLVLPIFLDNNAYTSGEEVRSYYGRLRERLAALPGVVDVGGATALPMSPLGPDFDRPVWREGDEPPPGGLSRADIRMATVGYFRTLGISVLRGRVFTGADGPDAPRTVIVNEALANRTWPGEDPIGRRLVIDYSTAGTYPYEVVGVVNDVRFRGLRSRPRPEVYLPHAQRSYLILNMAVRTVADPTALVADVRRAVLDVDPDQPAHSIVPLTELVGESVGRDRFSMLLLGAFAAAALSLAAMGIYGVLSTVVRLRFFEIGVRIALGARHDQIFKMVIRQGAMLMLLGIGLGLAASLALTRLLSGLLYDVSAFDPLTFVAVAGLLLVVGLAACALPARRATRVDPMVALRCE